MDDGAMGAGFAGSFGCEYCADKDNRFFGHLDQLCDESGGVVVLRCPRCGSFYEFDDLGRETVRLTVEQARERLPGAV
jgi:hypothetical protein